MTKAQELKLKIAASPLTQWEVAKQLGIDPATLSKILNGVTSMPDGFEADLQRAMNIALDEKTRKLIESREAVAA